MKDKWCHILIVLIIICSCGCIGDKKTNFVRVIDKSNNSTYSPTGYSVTFRDGMGRTWVYEEYDNTRQVYDAVQINEKCAITRYPSSDKISIINGIDVEHA
jgi:hypothetical protein